MKYSMISAEQGDNKEYQSVLDDARNESMYELRPNKSHIGRLLAILSPGCLAIGFSMSYASQAHSLLQVKFDWRDSDEKFYNWFM